MKHLLLPLLAAIAIPNIAVAHPHPQIEEQQESLEQSGSAIDKSDEKDVPLKWDEKDVPLMGYPKFAI